MSRKKADPQKSLRRLGAIPALFLLVGSVGVVNVQAERGSVSAKQWDFEDSQENSAPSEFSFTRTGSGRLGRWAVITQTDAPSRTHVLAQLDADATDFRFPIAAANESLPIDLRLSVKCKPVSGEVDRACGLVFRYQDENNYYITRANALEQNVRLYRVVNSNRQQLASWSGAVTSGAWHELRVEAQGDRFTIFWDGQQVIDAHDRTFSQAGRIGFWTKADSITYFDDLKVEPVAP